MQRYILRTLRLRRQSQADLARHMNISRQNLHFKMTSDRWTMQDLSLVAEFFGKELYTIIIESGQK